MRNGRCEWCSSEKEQEDSQEARYEEEDKAMTSCYTVKKQDNKYSKRCFDKSSKLHVPLPL